MKQPASTPQRTASSSDIVALLLSIGGSDLRALRDRALVLTLGTTGLRRAELARMQWTDLDLGSGELIVPQTKAGRPRLVRLGRDTARALRRYEHAVDAWDLDAGRESLAEVWISCDALVGAFFGIRDRVERCNYISIECVRAMTR